MILHKQSSLAGLGPSVWLRTVPREWRSCRISSRRRSPPELQPINFGQPAPQNLQNATTQSMFVSPAILLEAPAPPKPPVLTLAVVTPMVGSSSVNTAHTLNASGASSGFAINGTTGGVENGQTVTVTIVNGSGVTVDTFTS